MNFTDNDLNSKMLKYESYFDNMFKHVDHNIKLDEKQREAILIDEDNLLVIAGAGSGKTTTMVAKVKYLIDHCGYKESEIAVLSFTKKVEEELKRLIYNKFGYKNVNISTFHALGLKIINSAGENIKEIVDEKGQYKIFSNYIRDVLFKDKEKFKLFNNAYGKYLFFGEGWKKFTSFEEFHNYDFNKKFKESGFNVKKYNDDQIKRRRQYKKTIKGEYTASKEEIDIANFLYIHGIDYAYERKFFKPINNKAYHPDFFISQLEKQNYIEHFGIDQDGYNGMYTRQELTKYLDNLKIKQTFHNQRENENLFIVTYSKYDDDNTYLEHLRKELINKGYQFSLRAEEEIYEMLKNTSQDRYISRFIDKLLIPFISLYKQQAYKLDYLDKLINESSDNLKNQLVVMKDFFIYYEEELRNEGLIDFEDMISKAYYIMPKIKEKNLGVDYKYLIIDEYQDISRQRFNLLKKMSALFDAKIMAVGDDWQAIFGYAGSRIDLFKKFERQLINAKSVPIENTYRNSQELIDIAGKFILKNKDQIEKNLKSHKNMANPVELVFYDDSSFEKVDIKRSEKVDIILEFIYKNNPNSRVLLLGRYRKDIYKIQNDNLFTVKGDRVISKRFPDLNIEFLTIHKAKGLGCDYCILLDLNDDTYGFPSKIEDEPIIKLIRPKIDEPVDYPEERRLFYVALTRTKNKIFILIPTKKESKFSKEISDYEHVRKHPVKN